MLAYDKWRVAAALVAAAALVQTTSGEDVQPARSEKTSGLTIRLLDEGGRPVTGASVGLYAGWGDMNLEKAVWEYFSGESLESRDAKSDQNGNVRLSGSREQLSRFAVVARAPDRKLVGVGDFGTDTEAEVLTLTMKPECRVHGIVTCDQLAAHPRLKNDPESRLGTGVVIHQGRKIFVEYWSKNPDFECYLPPGEYELEARDEKGWTHFARSKFRVKPGQETLDLGAIDRPLNNLKRLEGEPAPELVDVVAWKNSAPMNLADLKGRVVLLDFFGYWCKPCVNSMPKLFELHDNYHNRGLTIIGVHIDAGDDEKVPVDSVTELDKRLGDIRKNIWRGRDIPYPVSLIRSRRTPYGEGIQGSTPAAIPAIYGVMGYPTYVLIDREGRVAGAFYPDEEQIRRLEKLLAE